VIYRADTARDREMSTDRCWRPVCRCFIHWSGLDPLTVQCGQATQIGEMGTAGMSRTLGALRASCQSCNRLDVPNSCPNFISQLP